MPRTFNETSANEDTRLMMNQIRSMCDKLERLDPEFEYDEVALAHSALTSAHSAIATWRSTMRGLR